jgi:GT2 family glycosyltransferase
MLPARPDITVGIVHHNQRGLTQACLESLLLFNRDLRLEVIVVDNATTDGSGESLAARFPQVRFIRQTNPQGFAANHNLIATQASASAYLALNDDTLWLPTDPALAAPILARLGQGKAPWTMDEYEQLAGAEMVGPGPLAVLLQQLQTDPVIGAIAPLLIWPDGRPQDVSARPFPTPWSELRRYLALDRRAVSGGPLPAGMVPALSGCALLTRHHVWLALNGLDEQYQMYGEDLDFCQRLTTAGWRCWFEPQVRLIHYGSQSTSREPFRWTVAAVQSSTRYYRRHAGLLTALLFRMAITLILLGRWLPLLPFQPRRRAERLAAIGALFGLALGSNS